MQYILCHAISKIVVSRTKMKSVSKLPGILLIILFMSLAGRIHAQVNWPPAVADYTFGICGYYLNQLDLTADDPDDDELTYQIVTPPSHGKLIGNMPKVYYQAADLYVGPDQFSYSVNDGNGPIQGTVTLNVEKIPDIDRSRYASNTFAPPNSGEITLPLNHEALLKLEHCRQYKKPFWLGIAAGVYGNYNGSGGYPFLPPVPPITNCTFSLLHGDSKLTLNGAKQYTLTSDILQFSSYTDGAGRHYLRANNASTVGVLGYVDYGWQSTGMYMPNRAGTFLRFFPDLDKPITAATITLKIANKNNDVIPWLVIIPGDQYSLVDTPEMNLWAWEALFYPGSGWYGLSSFAPLSQRNANASPTDGDPVNLTSGEEEHSPGADLIAYNPSGPAALFRRTFYSYRAKQGYGSPGLSPGWVHNYDYRMQATVGVWCPVRLTEPNGSSTSFTPEIGAGNIPTGKFSVPAGGGYILEGEPDTQVGKWNSITLTMSDETHWCFTPLAGDENSYILTRLTNKVDKSININWDGSRRLSSINDVSTASQLLTFTYHTNAIIASIQDSTNRTINYSSVDFTVKRYDEQGFLVDTALPCLTTVSKINSQAAQWTYGYSLQNEQPLLTTMNQPSPSGTDTSTFTLEYDQSGRVISQTNANGTTTRYLYGLFRKLPGPNGIGEINESQTQVQTFSVDGTTMLDAYVQFFDELGRNTGIQDVNGNRSLIEYSDANNPYKVTRYISPDNKTTLMQYDNYGNLISLTDIGTGITSNYTYDYTEFPLGRVTQIQEGNRPPILLSHYPNGLLHVMQGPAADGSGHMLSTSYTYDSLGNTLTITADGNEPGKTITISYNYAVDGEYQQTPAFAQPLTTIDDQGNSAHMRYDAYGRVLSISDSEGQTVTHSYSPAGSLSESILPSAGETSTKLHYSYLYDGGPLTRKETLTKESPTANWEVIETKEFAYDKIGNIWKITTDGKALEYTFDALGRVIQLKDDQGRITSYTFDNDIEGSYDGKNTKGRPIQVTFPGNQIARLTKYDPAGRLLEQIDRSGLVTSYTYDQQTGAMTDQRYPAAPELDVHNTYDARLRLQSVSGINCIESFTYDDATDNLLSVITQYSELPPQTISYAYDQGGNLKSMTTPAGNFHYQYDEQGRLTNLANPAGRTSQWRYDQGGNLRQQILGNRAWTKYEYDDLGLLQRQENCAPNGEPLSEYTDFTYDKLGNYTEVKANLPGLPKFSGLQSYGYDAENQLASEQFSPLQGTELNQNYLTDLSGNISNFPYELPVPGAVARAYNEQNQWIGYTNAQGASVGSDLFAYDGNGNPTTYKGNQLTFDGKNHLLEYRDAENQLLFKAAYRPDGQRAWKEDAAGKRTYFLYSGSALLCELNEDAKVVAYNTYGPDGLISRASRLQNGALREVWYLFDYQGNVAQRLDVTGHALSADKYDAWGNLLQGGDDTDPYGFKAQVGYYTDHETGLLLLTHRYYDPQAGRFLTIDPIGYTGGLNLYQYCVNNPVMAIDPFGLASQYWSQVGGVLQGYGNILNPFKAAEGLGAFSINLDNGGWQCAQVWKMMGKGLIDGMKFWEAESPQEFGERFGTVLMTVAPVLAKVPSPGYMARLKMPMERLGMLAQRVKDAITTPNKSLSLGSTANPSKGSYLPRNLREQMAVEEAMSDPINGEVLPLKMEDTRWPAVEGWKKMQRIIDPGGKPITVHYVRNLGSGAVDDFKIVE